MADFGGNDEQDIKINIDVVGADESASKLDRLADSLDSMASPEALAAQTAAQIAAAEKVAAEERRIAALSAADRKAERERQAAEDARLTAKYDAERAERATTIAAAREAALKRQQEQEAIAASVAEAAVKSRLDALKGLESESEKIARIERENLATLSSQEETLNSLYERERSLADLIERSSAKRREARDQASELEQILRRQQETELKPYSGALISPSAITAAEKELAELQKKIKTLDDASKAARSVVDLAPRSTRIERDESTGKSKTVEQVRIPSPTGQYTAEDRAARESFIASVKALLGDKPKGIDTSDSATLFNQLEALVKKANQVGPGNYSGIQQGETAAIETNAKLVQLLASLSELKKKQEEVEGQVLSGPPKGASPKSSEARNYADTVAQMGKIYKEIQDMEAAVASEQARLKTQREVVDAGKKAFDSRGLGVSADQMPKLIDLLSRIRSSIELREKITATTPTVVVDESEARRALPSTRELDEARKKAKDLEEEISRALGKSGEYKKPVTRDGKTVTSGPRESDPEGRSAAQLKKAIKEAKDEEETSGKFEAGFRDSKKEIDKAIQEAKVALVEAFSDARKRITDAVGPLVESINLDKIFEDLLKDIADKMVEQFKKTGKRTEAEVERFRAQVLSTGESEIAATPSFTASGAQRRGSRVIRIKPGDPEPEVPMVGAARTALSEIIGKLFKASPLLRGVANAQVDRDRDESVRIRMEQLRGVRVAAAQIPPSLSGMGTITPTDKVTKRKVNQLEAEYTTLSGIEPEIITLEQAQRLEEVKEELKQIKELATSISGEGPILGILRAIGVNPEGNIGNGERSVKGIRSAFAGMTPSALFTPRTGYTREGEQGPPLLQSNANPVDNMLTTRVLKTGERGVESQKVVREGEDLTEFFETVQVTSVNIGALFAQIVTDLKRNKASDPALLPALSDEITGLLHIMDAVSNLEIDSEAPKGVREKLEALKQVVASLGSEGGGVIEALKAISSGGLDNSKTIGAKPEERTALVGDMAKYILTPLIPNLDALTSAAKNLTENRSQKTAGSGQAEIAGVPFGDNSAVGDQNVIKGIVETVAGGNADQIRKVIAEAIARNVLDADKLRAMIPGETAYGVAPRNEEIAALSAQPGKFEIATAENANKFAEIIANIPEVMKIFGDFTSLAEQIFGADGAQVIEDLAAEETKAKEQFVALQARLEAFRKAIPKLAEASAREIPESTTYGFSGGGGRPISDLADSRSVPLPEMRPVTDASQLTEEEARTITPDSIPPHLLPLYANRAGAGLGPDGVPYKTATGFGPQVDDDYQLSEDEARKVAQEVIDFLRSQGLSLATTEISQSTDTQALGKLAPGSTGSIPAKTIITVIHKGEKVTDDITVSRGLQEAIRMLGQVPTVNRGMTIASYPSTDVRVPGTPADEPTPPGYSGVTAGVLKPDQTVETYASMHLAERMRLRDNGPLIPVPGARTIASHESGHMGVIGGNVESVFQRKEDMLPIHDAIMHMIKTMARALQDPSQNISEEMRAKMENVVEDFFDNIEPGVIEESILTGSNEKLNVYVGEFIANALAQMAGHFSGAGRGISFGPSGQFSGDTLEFLKQMLEQGGPPPRAQSKFERSREPRFVEETPESLYETYKQKGGLTRRIVRKGDGFGITSEEPEKGYTVGGVQLENEKSGLLNFAKTDISGKESLAEALTALFEENKDKIEEMMIGGAAVWIGMFTQGIKPVGGGEAIEGTAFDITSLIPDQGAARELAMERGQDSYGSYEDNNFVWKDEFQIRQPGEEQPQTMTRNEDGSFSRVPGTLSGELPVDRKYGYRTKSRREAARTRRAERRAASSAELDQVLEGQTVTVSGGPIGTANITNFDAYRCQQCGKLTSDRAGGVNPNGTDAYCAECWKKVEPFYNETNPKDGYKYDKYDSKRMQGSEFRGMVNRRTEGLDDEGLAELKQSEYEDHLVRYYRGEEGNDIGEMADRQERLFADENIAKSIAQSRAAFERDKAKRKKEQEGPIEGTATTISETPGGRIYGFSGGPRDEAILDFDFSDMDDDATQLGKMPVTGEAMQLGKIKREGKVIPLATGSGEGESAQLGKIIGEGKNELLGKIVEEAKTELAGMDDDATQLGKMPVTGEAMQLGKIKREGKVIPLAADSADLDFDFSDMDDDGSIEEDSSDTYAPVEEEKPKPKKEKKPRKKKAPVGAGDRSTLVTPREAEIAQAEELGVSTEELATLTPAQIEGLIRQRQEKDMAENAKRDEERLKTAGTRAEAGRKKAREIMDPRARLETPMEAQIDEGAEVGLSPDEAARVDPSVIAKRKRDADEAKIAELNAADAARLKKIHDDQQARSAAAAAREKAASDRKNAADAARAKAKEEEAKTAEESVPKATEAPKAPAEPTREEAEEIYAEELKNQKARIAALRRARAAARKAAKAEEAAAAATEKSAEASDAVARAETEAAASKTEVAQEIASPESGTPPAPPAPPRPPAPPTPPAGGDGGGEDSEAQKAEREAEFNAQVDAVNKAIQGYGLGTNLPTLNAMLAELNKTIDGLVEARVAGAAAGGVQLDPAIARESLIKSNVGGIGELFEFLTRLSNEAKTIRVSKEGGNPVVDYKGTPLQVPYAAAAIGKEPIPEGMKPQQLVKIAEEFDAMQREVVAMMMAARAGGLRIKEETEKSVAGGAGGGGGGNGGGGGSADPGKSPMQWGDKGVATPDLVNIFKGEKDLRNLTNVFRELRPQVAHVRDNIDEVATNLQKQNRAAQDTTRALAGYMNVNTGILKSLKTQVGRAATFLFVQQMGREIAGVVEHLQSGVFKFNQVLENTQVGFNTLFANTLQASTSARNELVPSYNAVGAQIGFVKEQALTFNEALALTSNAASNMVEKIRDIANVTPFRFQPLVEASLKMKAFGFEAVEIPGMINSISNAVAALGGEDEKIDRIAYALGQMNSAGRVYQNDMMQLANAGIAGYRMLADKMLSDLVALKKYTMGELKDLPDYVIDEMKRLQGAISSASFEKSFGGIDTMINTLQDPRRAEGLIRNMAKRGFLLGSVAARAITEGMDKQYQGSADRLSRTMTGALSTIADLSQNFMATAFEPIFNSVRDTIVELGQFMLKSQEITEFVLRVKDNVKGFVDGLKNFGPVLENMAGIFINVFVGGIGAAMEKGSQFGEILENIVQKLSAGFSLVGDILNDKVGRGLATAATLGTVFVKAIMANPMIATIALIAVAISGIAEAIKTNFFMIGTVMNIFMESIKNIIQVITEAMATIAKDIGTSAITSFVAGLTAAIVILTPFLQVLLHTFAFFLKILTPFAPILGVLLGLFLAFKTATMIWNIATLALAKPIAAITSAWGGAAKAVNQYQEQIKLTAQMHADLQQKKIAAQDYVRGTDGQPLKDKDGRPILNYDPATESVSSAGYPSQSAGEAAQATVNAGTRVRGVLEKIDERLPGPLKGLLVSPRERIMGAIKPDFNGGLTLSHNDSAREGHLSTVITTEKLEKRFDSFKPGGELAGLGKQMSAAGILNIPGLDKGEINATANKYSTAWGENLKALVLIEKEVSYVLSEAFRKMQDRAKEYRSAVAKVDADVAEFKSSGNRTDSEVAKFRADAMGTAADPILQQTIDSEEGRILLPMLTTAKYGKDKKHTDLTKDEISAMMGSFFTGGMSLTPEQMRNVESLPPEVQQIIYNQAAKKVASGNSRLTGGPGGEQEQLDTAVAAGRAKAMVKGGSIGVIDGISKKITSFFDSLNKGTANLVKNIPILQKLQKINMGGAGTGMQQIQKTERGAYRYVNEDGSMGKYVGKEELANRRSMRFTPGGRFSRAFGMAGAMAGIASGASRMAGMGNQAYSIASTLMPGITDMLGSGFKQVMTQKAGFFQGLGNSVGTMLGAGLGSMVPIIGPILGPAIGGMIGELAGNIIDTATRASQAAIDAKKRLIEGNKSLGLDDATAKAAAEAELKIRAAEGYIGANAGGIPFLVNDLPESASKEERANRDAFNARLNTKENLVKFDTNKDGMINDGAELQAAVRAINEKIMTEVVKKGELTAGEKANIFKKNDKGEYIHQSAAASSVRERLKTAGYVEDATSTAALTVDDLAALTAKQKAQSAIDAASMSESQFLEMFPDFKLNSNDLAQFNNTEVTAANKGTVKGDRYRKALGAAGLSIEEAQSSPMLMQLLQTGSDMKTVVAGLQKNKDSGAKLDDASEKLLAYASLLETQNLGSFRDENGNIRTEYQPGMARLLAYNSAQATATANLGSDNAVGGEGDAADTPGADFTKIFGFRQVADGTGIGGGDTMYSAMFMEGLKAMGRIDPMEAMLEAGVIQSIDEMVGKSAAEIMEMWKKTGEYFEAFRKRAEELEPKVNLRMSRLELMEEFGKDKGYELYDQFEGERAKLATMDKEFAALGGSRELADLEYFNQLMGETTTTTTPAGRDRDNERVPAGTTVEQILPGLLTPEELGKMERLRELQKQILDYEKQKFPIKVRTKAIDSTDEKIRAQAVRDEAALATFRREHQTALDAIQAKAARGEALTRDEVELNKQVLALRDKLIITTTEEVSLGETLAILEKEGISISNKDLHNNDTLLAILAAKAKLQESANTAGRGAVYWSNLEAKAKVVVTRLAEKQIDLELLRQELYRNTQGGIGMAMAAEAKFQKENATLIKETNELLLLQESYTKQLANNPYAFNKAELDQINALLAKAPGSMIDAAGASADAAAIQRNTSLLNTMANVAQKSYERIRKAQQKTHDEYIEQLNEQQQAIEERYRKRGDEQQEQSLLQQLQLAGLAMRSESADPLEAAKSFYEAKNNLAEFYIEKQKNDEIKAIEDEKERYGKQFKENTEAQEAIYGASMDRMKNRFEAVNRVLGEEAIDPADLKNLLLLTMSGKVPTITSNYDKTMAALFEQVDKQVAEGKQELALGEGLGTISIGTLTPDGNAYTANRHLVDGDLDKNIKSKYGFDKIYKGSNEESGLLATFMNEILAAGVTFTDSGETYTGAAALEYLKKIKPSRGFEMGAAAGKEEQGRERQGLFEYLTSLLSTTNTFDSSQKLAILAQRTLEQSISDFEKATKIDVNMAGLLEADIANELFENFLKSMGQTPDEAKIKELQELVRDTYTDVLAAMDAREYEKFASSADPRIGQLTNQVDQISDSITHLKDSLDGGLTNLDKLLFGTTYNSAAPIPGIDVATEQIDVITASILDMQTAFEGTMDSLEAYADSLEGPIGAFHQMVADIQSIAGLAGGITLPSAGTAAPTPSGGTGKMGAQSDSDFAYGGPAPDDYENIAWVGRTNEESKKILQGLMQQIINNGGEQMLSNMPVLGGVKSPKPVVDAPAGSPEAEIIARLQRAEENLKIQQKLRDEAARSGMFDTDMGMELSKAKMELDRARAEYEKYISGTTPIDDPDEYRQVRAMPVPPITEFNAELKARLAEYAAAFASSIQTVGINGAQTTVTMYNQIPITITINDAQDMNTADLAAQVEEAVGRAIRASGGSYINGTTS